ncbi:MAG: DUF1273 family protein [Clostridia bacterium]|nr:DUF1273 family protein [Clostridia bacterium]
MKTVCFTGHRTIPDSDYLRLWQVLDTEIDRLIRNGAEVFRTGGALGFDTIAALNVLSHRLKHPHIRLELILPCPTQTNGWRGADVDTYRQILAQADAHRYIAQSYYSGVLQARNRALVDGADICVAYLRSSHGGGTAYTVAYALQGGLELINLHEQL